MDEERPGSEGRQQGEAPDEKSERRKRFRRKSKDSRGASGRGKSMKRWEEKRHHERQLWQDPELLDDWHDDPPGMEDDLGDDLLDDIDSDESAEIDGDFPPSKKRGRKKRGSTPRVFDLDYDPSEWN